jgi:hypothetical protein
MPSFFIIVIQIILKKNDNFENEFHYLFQTKNFKMKGIQMCHPNKKF